LKEEALDRNLWRTRFGRGYGPVVRQTTEWITIPTSYCNILYLYILRIWRCFIPMFT
jgi:hypothetical protein